MRNEIIAGLVSSSTAIPLAMAFGMFAFVSLGDEYFAYGAMAGLLSAGLAATLYASHCPDDSPLFVATWYTIATALVTAIGALVGSKVLRF